MSVPTTFKVHYGVGTVRESPCGVDLSSFPQATLVHPDGENARIADVMHWLTTSFSLDPEVCSVYIQGLWSRSPTYIRWELRPLMRTAVWKGFIEGCRRRGYECVLLVQPCSKEAVQGPAVGYHPGGGSSSGAQHVDEEEDPEGGVTKGSDDVACDEADAADTAEEDRSPHGEPTGQADEGEHREYILRQMDSDDRMALAEEEALQEDDEDSSDEDGAPIPQEWNRYTVEGVTTHDEHESRWEYHATEVRLHSMFADKTSLQDACNIPIFLRF